MTIAITLAQMATNLATISPLPSPFTGQTLTTYPNPFDATTVANFPSIVLSIAPNVENVYRNEALGLSRADWNAALYLFLGPRTMKLNELHGRTVPWPDLINGILAGDMTLGSKVAFIGYGDGRLWTWKMGTIPWGSGTYWGIKGTIPVTEKRVITMG